MDYMNGRIIFDTDRARLRGSITALLVVILGTIMPLFNGSKIIVINFLKIMA